MEALVTTTGRRLMGRIPLGSDLLQYLVQKCRDSGITLGEMRGVGALRKARMACFDQPTRRYEFIEFDQDLDISLMIGNISLLGPNPTIHAHLVLVDDEGNAIGGQLAKGCEVYAVEYVIVEYQSEKLFERELDEETGLMLWRDNLLH